MSAIIRSSRGETILVDESVLPLVNQIKWSTHEYAPGLKYATTTRGNNTVYMHRLLTSCPDGLVVDHINHNGLDNRIANLRIVRHFENLHNAGRSKRPGTSSRYRGVSRTRNGKWRARIWVHDVDYSLGCFFSEEKAAQAYAEAKLRLLSQLRRI